MPEKSKERPKDWFLRVKQSDPKRPPYKRGERKTWQELHREHNASLRAVVDDCNKANGWGK